MLHVRDLEHWYAGARAPTFAALTFDLSPGALATIAGASGAGKTTLLRCLAGLEPFRRGTIELPDLRVAAGDGAPQAHAQLRGRVGLVFQSLELFPHLTALENCILAPIRVRGLPPRDAEARARTLLAELGLDAKAGEFPARLSGGQRQRVAIARALAMEPSVLLYDEPTSALDPSLKSEVVEALRRVQTTGVTQLVVTHDATLADAAGDVRFILEAGTLQPGRR